MIFEKQIVGTFRNNFLRRCDDTGTAFYFSAADFPGLQADPFCFPSSKGHTLQGYFYHYDDPIPGRIVVFDHGFGGGHRSYMKEIELLCRHGYLVFTYDHTGCMESGGQDIGGFSQSLFDLNDCLNALKATDRCRGLDFSVMGHSWGGFSTLNICVLHPDISHIVVLSGFVAVEVLVNQFFGGPLKGYRKAILDLDPTPEYFQFHAVESLANTDAQVLLVYSDNDKLVNKKVHFDALKAGLSHKGNIRFLLEKNKGHNPNYTEDAVKYKNERMAVLKKLLKKKQLTTDEAKAAFVKSCDWVRMTKQDDEIWNKIFDFIEK